MTGTPVNVWGLGAQLRDRQAGLAADLVERQFAARPELAARYGPAGRAKCLQDANFHLGYLADAMNAGEPALFADYMAWAKVMLGTRGIPAQHLAQHLELMRLVISEVVGGASGALAAEYLSAAITRLPGLPDDLLTGLSDASAHSGLARDYLAALLRGERHIASRMILAAVASGIHVREIYLSVFQPVQYEVGRLWQINKISVAQEHYCTAATQLVMSQLYPQIFASEKGAGTLVATCVAGDLHEIGLRMVTDFFEMEGWDTYYLGANMPSEAVVDTVVQRHADVLAISATISLHLGAVKELIGMVRARAECGRVKILVGGYPFRAAPELWKRVGADGCASSAQEATAMAAQLVAHKLAP